MGNGKSRCPPYLTQFDARDNEIETAFLGIDGKPVSGSSVLWQLFKYTLADALRPKQVTVVSILPDSQGEKLGIQAGDIFTHYDGKPLTDMSSFIASRTDEPADGPAKALKVLREGKELTFMLKPGKIGVELTDSVK